MNHKLLTDRSPLRIMQYVVYGSAILYFGRDLFIPLAFAMLISFILYPSCKWMEKFGISRMTAIIINVSLLMLLVSGVVALLMSQFFAFLKEWPSVQQKLSDSWQQFSQFIIRSYGITREQQDNWGTQITEQLGSQVLPFLRQTFMVSSFTIVMTILIPVYAILILYYRRLWIEVVLRLFPHERKESIYEIVQLTIQAYYNFIKGMALVYVVVGALNSTGLLLLGVPHAILFGFIASILTFIPYIGIVIGSLLPITMAWITYDSPWYPLGVVGIFTLVQYLEANVIFPLAVSNRLKVNTLVILVVIFLGVILWGVAGMILFIPFVGILKLIADHNRKLRTLSVILGTKPSE